VQPKGCALLHHPQRRLLFLALTLRLTHTRILTLRLPPAYVLLRASMSSSSSNSNHQRLQAYMAAPEKAAKRAVLVQVRWRVRR
jgi:hypothetical protein